MKPGDVVYLYSEDQLGVVIAQHNIPGYPDRYWAVQTDPANVFIKLKHYDDIVVVGEL